MYVQIYLPIDVYLSTRSIFILQLYFDLKEALLKRETLSKCSIIFSCTTPAPFVFSKLFTFWKGSAVIGDIF